MFELSVAFDAWETPWRLGSSASFSIGETWIRFVIEKAPSPRTAEKSSFVIGLNTTPTSGSPSSSKADGNRETGIAVRKVRRAVERVNVPFISRSRSAAPRRLLRRR